MTYRNGVDIDQGHLGREKVDIAAGNCPVKGGLDQLRQVGRDFDGRHTVRQYRNIVTEWRGLLDPEGPWGLRSLAEGSFGFCRGKRSGSMRS